MKFTALTRLERNVHQVGEIVGVGIFLTPAEMAKALGSPFWILVVWLTVGLSTTRILKSRTRASPPMTSNDSDERTLANVWRKSWY